MILCLMLAILWFYQSLPLKPLDYGHLDKLLATQDWEAADYETSILMQKITSQQRRFSAKFLDIVFLGQLRIPIQVSKIPCQHLLMLNKLWTQYSENRFGFSIQRSVWKTLDSDLRENVDTMTLEYSKIFFGKVGIEWGRGQRESIYEKIENFSLTELPHGYLPHDFYYKTYSLKEVNGVGYSSFPSRIMSILIDIESCLSKYEDNLD